MTTATTAALAYGRLRHRIGAHDVAGTGETLPIHNPATGEVIAEVPLGGATEVGAAVEAAARAFPAWELTPGIGRS